MYHVLIALKYLPEDTDIPWQRVIASSGKSPPALRLFLFQQSCFESVSPGEISSRGPATTGAQRQADALALESVEVHEGAGGKLRVSLREYGWFPETVEGEAGAEGEGDAQNHGVAAGAGHEEANEEGGEELGTEGDSDSDLTSLDSEDLDGEQQQS